MKRGVKVVVLGTIVPLALVVLALGTAAAILGLPLLVDWLVARYTAPPAIE